MDYLKIFYGFEKTDARGQKNKNLVFEISHNGFINAYFLLLVIKFLKEKVLEYYKCGL